MSARRAEHAFRVRSRFIYRERFEPIPGTQITSDAGWGCCYRCCQGFLCEYVMRLCNRDLEVALRCFGGKKPFELFMDALSSEFSIQNIVCETQRLYGLRPGEWARPTQAAHAVAGLMRARGLSAHVAMNSVIDEAALDAQGYPLLLMVPLMCGMRSLEEEYMPFVLHALSQRASLGIVSGRAGAAHYIVGSDGDNVLYFDPHKVGAAVTTVEQCASYFDPPLHAMRLSRMNPSMLLCFECVSAEATRSLVSALTDFPRSPVLNARISEEQMRMITEMNDANF